MSAHHPEMSHRTVQDHAPGIRGIRWNMDWITRPLFGIALAVVAVFVVLYPNPVVFAVVVSGIGALAAFEWHRIVAAGKPHRVEAALTAITIALSAITMAASKTVLLPIGLVALGAIAQIFAGSRRGGTPVWHVLGLLYLGLPSLALVAVRSLVPHNGAMMVIGLFIIVWATDTGALICGNLIGGPRIAPALSPGKTWAGTIGGSVIGAVAFGLFIALISGSPLLAAGFAFVLSFVAHAGDLFESFIKRRFGIKDSGAVIPGHGGILDRMDSTLGAAMVLALLVFAFHFNPLIGVHS